MAPTGSSVGWDADDTPAAPPWARAGGGGSISSGTISYLTNYEEALTSGALPPLLYLPWEGFANPSNFVLEYPVSLPPVGPDPPLDSRIQAHSPTQDEFVQRCIDPQLLSITRPADSACLGTHLQATTQTPPDLGSSFTPTTAPTTNLDGNRTNVIPTGHRLSSPTIEAQEQGTSRIPCLPSQENNQRVHIQGPSPHHKKRRAKPLENLTQQLWYHSLPAVDREYFDRVVARLRSAPYLVSPQAREPTVGSFAGLQLVGPRRFTGPGTATNLGSVYAILIHRPAEGAYVCWLCGEERTDRRLPRALGHIRRHFEHRPYHCLERHSNHHTSSGPLLPSVSVCGQSFPCAEALKDHQVKMKDKSHPCDTCGNVYTNAANLKRHVRVKHSN